MKKIFIIGSANQDRDVKLVASTLRSIDENVVRCVNFEDLKLEERIIKDYKNIDWCDVVYIVYYDNLNISEYATYLKIYAKQHNKFISYVGV